MYLILISFRSGLEKGSALVVVIFGKVFGLVCFILFVDTLLFCECVQSPAALLRNQHEGAVDGEKRSYPLQVVTIFKDYKLTTTR